VKQLINYTRKYSEGALLHLHDYAQTNEAEELHQLRVALKKLKAVEFFLSTTTKETGKLKTTGKHLKKIFKAAGAIRQKEIVLNWMQEHSFQLLAETVQLSRQIQEEQELFFKKQHLYKKQLQKQSAVYLEYAQKMKAADAEVYIQQLKQMIHEGLQNIRQEGWHELRKQVKQLLYVWQWLNAKQKLHFFTAKEFQYFDLLQEQIGNWHDLIDLKQWLTDGEFFLNSDARIKQEFNRCWQLLNKQLMMNEKRVQTQLTKPVL
jgi:CHAD domain-containing protein